MNILHICAGWEKWNGAANIARLIMGEQKQEGHAVSFCSWASIRQLRSADEVWIHCSWMPCLWWAALWGKNVHWVPECSYDPIRRAYHGWKKTLVGPIERFCLRRAKTLVATCEAEAGWIRSYLGRRCPPIEVTDIKRFFKLNGNALTQSRRVAECAESDIGLPSADGGLGQRPRDNSASSRLCVNSKNNDEPLHILYLGRRHPLKGVEYLETAVRQIEKTSAYSAPLRLCVKIVSSAFGDELEKVWDWCDVLVLPTLSENFGLVIAEALERGKRVITTDGAPAWGENLSRVEYADHVEGGEMLSGYGGRMLYLKGYRDGTPDLRINLLSSAITLILGKQV